MTDKELDKKSQAPRWYGGANFYMSFVEFGWRTGSRRGDKQVAYVGKGRASYRYNNHGKPFLSVRTRAQKRRTIPPGGVMRRPPFQLALQEGRSSAARIFSESIVRGIERTTSEEGKQLRKRAREL